MLEIVPYDKELLLGWEYNGIEQKLSGIQINPMVEFYSKLGESYIGLIDNKIIGLGGVYPLWNGAGSAWLFLNKEAHNYKKSIFKILLKYMNILIKKYKISNLIIECIDNSLEAHRLIQHLGFIKDKEIKLSMYFKRIGKSDG